MAAIKLSCTLATFNEEENIGRCLEAVKDLVDEIVIVDGGSTDRTVEIAKKYGAKVIVTENPRMFHINKNKANELAKGEWILQLDADEVVSSDLKREIEEIVEGPEKVKDEKDRKISNIKYQISKSKEDLFERHQRAIELRQGKIGTDEGEVVAYFMPRRNYFLGKFLRYGGTYPDGVIRLFKKGKAKFPEKDLHEQYKVDGRVGWLSSPLLHYDSPTFERYLVRNNAYSSRFAEEMVSREGSSFAKASEDKGISRLSWVSGAYYLFVKPVWIFLMIYFRHKGFLDGFPGLVWAMYSGLTWRAAYIKLWEKL